LHMLGILYKIPGQVKIVSTLFLFYDTQKILHQITVPERSSKILILLIAL